MKKSRLTRPFDLLSTSMNYFQAFVPSSHHGVSVLCDVYPTQQDNGNVRTNNDDTVDLYCVPDPEDPSAGERWGLSNLLFRLGLPVPGQGLDRPVKEIRDNNYDLSVNRYRQIAHEEIDHIPPKQLIAELNELEREIEDGLKT